jgi:hypothetical protein
MSPLFYRSGDVGVPFGFRPKLGGRLTGVAR